MMIVRDACTYFQENAFSSQLVECRRAVECCMRLTCVDSLSSSGLKCAELLHASECEWAQIQRGRNVCVSVCHTPQNPFQMSENIFVKNQNNHPIQIHQQRERQAHRGIE